MDSRESEAAGWNNTPLIQSSNALLGLVTRSSSSVERGRARQLKPQDDIKSNSSQITDRAFKEAVSLYLK